jgi:pilus assembly protein CpaC
MKTKLQFCLIALGLAARMAFGASDVPTDAPSAGAVDDSGSSRSVVKGPPIALYHGEVQVLDLTNVVRIAVGNGEVLRANVVASDQVVLIGQSAGTTSLRVWTRKGTQFTYEVTVRSFDVAQILRDVQDLLAGEPGISARQVDGHVLIEGDYTAARTATRLQALMKIYPQIISTVPVHKEAPTVPQERMVYMDVRVVEILKTTMRQLGVNWQQATTGGLNASVNLGASKNMSKPLNGSYFGIAANLMSTLDLTESAGESWTLAEPTVSCKSGGSAKFTVGGEVPIPVSQGFGQTSVVYHDYGIILQFKPVADDQGNISSSIVAEVSQPDSSLSNLGNNGLVAFTKTSTETDVTLKEDQTLVISGLLENDGNRSAAGIPGAKDLPILGNLFKSKGFKNERTELVVLVTPRSVAAQHQANDTSIREADQLTKRVEPIINMINSKLAE